MVQYNINLYDFHYLKYSSQTENFNLFLISNSPILSSICLFRLTHLNKINRQVMILSTGSPPYNPEAAAHRQTLPTIYIQCCHHCDSHLATVKHQQVKYTSHFQLVQQHLAEQGYTVRKRPPPPELYRQSPYCPPNVFYRGNKQIVFFPQIGSFQVFLGDTKVFSKLDTQRWPEPEHLLTLIKSQQNKNVETSRPSTDFQRQSEERKVKDLASRTNSVGWRGAALQNDRYSLDKRNLLVSRKHNKISRSLNNRSMNKRREDENNQAEIIKLYSPQCKKQEAGRLRVELDNIPSIQGKARVRKANVYLEPLFPKSRVSYQNYQKHRLWYAKKIHEQKLAFDAEKAENVDKERPAPIRARQKVSNARINDHVTTLERVSKNKEQRISNNRGQKPEVKGNQVKNQDESSEVNNIKKPYAPISQRVKVSNNTSQKGNKQKGERVSAQPVKQQNNDKPNYIETPFVAKSTPVQKKEQAHKESETGKAEKILIPDKQEIVGQKQDQDSYEEAFQTEDKPAEVVDKQLQPENKVVEVEAQPFQPLKEPNQPEDKPAETQDKLVEPEYQAEEVENEVVKAEDLLVQTAQNKLFKLEDKPIESKESSIEPKVEAVEPEDKLVSDSQLPGEIKQKSVLKKENGTIQEDKNQANPQADLLSELPVVIAKEEKEDVGLQLVAQDEEVVDPPKQEAKQIGQVEQKAPQYEGQQFDKEERQQRKSDKQNAVEQVHLE